MAFCIVCLLNPFQLVCHVSKSAGIQFDTGALCCMSVLLLLQNHPTGVSISYSGVVAVTLKEYLWFGNSQIW